MTHMGHRTETCRCGNVIRTCPCMNPENPTVVICQSCSACVGDKQDGVAAAILTAEKKYLEALEDVAKAALGVVTRYGASLRDLRAALVRLDAARKARTK